MEKFLTSLTVKLGLNGHKLGYLKHRKLERLLHRKNQGFRLVSPGQSYICSV